MSDPVRCGRLRKPERICRTAGRAALLAMALLASPAIAQDGAKRPPVSPPAAAPVSRLVITPSEFERWLARTPERPEVVAAPEDLPPGPGLVAPPPPLLTPPPEPRLVAPPPAPKMAEPPPSPALTAPPPEPRLSVEPGAPPRPTGTKGDAALPGPGTVGAPPAPVLTPPESPQVATLPPASGATTPAPKAPEPPPAEIRILFAADATDLPEGARKHLDGLAGWLKANPDVRVQIVGFASAAAATGADARRRSLFRTLAVRTYLIENGVLSTRMDVRALGDRTDVEPKDRVEVRVPPT